MKTIKLQAVEQPVKKPSKLKKIAGGLGGLAVAGGLGYLGYKYGPKALDYMKSGQFLKPGQKIRIPGAPNLYKAKAADPALIRQAKMAAMKKAINWKRGKTAGKLAAASFVGVLGASALSKYRQHLRYKNARLEQMPVEKRLRIRRRYPTEHPGRGQWYSEPIKLFYISPSTAKSMTGAFKAIKPANYGVLRRIKPAFNTIGKVAGYAAVGAGLGALYKTASFVNATGALGPGPGKWRRKILRKLPNQLDVDWKNELRY